MIADGPTPREGAAILEGLTFAREAARYREALELVFTILRTENGGTHKRMGEACGEDACYLCLAEETAREALGLEKERS